MSTTTGSNAPLSQLNDTPAELSTGLVRLKHIILALLLSVVFSLFSVLLRFMPILHGFCRIRRLLRCTQSQAC